MVAWVEGTMTNLPQVMEEMINRLVAMVRTTINPEWVEETMTNPLQVMVQMTNRPVATVKPVINLVWVEGTMINLPQAMVETINHPVATVKAIINRVRVDQEVNPVDMEMIKVAVTRAEAIIKAVGMGVLIKGKVVVVVW